ADQIHYNQLLDDLEVASDSLTAANTAAQNRVDSLGDADFTGFATSLQGVMNKKLTLTATVSSNIDQTYLTANGTRVSMRALFESALATFQGFQDQLTEARDTLQSFIDQLLVAQADVQIDIAQLDIDQAQLSYDRSQLAIDQAHLAIDTVNNDLPAI